MVVSVVKRRAARAGVRLNVYVLYIHDDRYTVPTVDSIKAADDESAKQLLRRRLQASSHYFAVALWNDERLVERIEKDAGCDASDA